LPRYSGISPVKIETNPSRFHSFKDLKGLISKVFTDSSTLKVTRVDHCADIGIPIEIVFKSLIFSRKKSREQFMDSKLTGFSFGNSPEKLVVYDKAFKEKIHGIVTRVELRHFGSKVTHRDFDSLSSYLSFHPFNALKFNRLVASPVGNLREQRKRELVAELMEAGGAQGMFKTLNRQSNFNRDFKNCFETNPDIPDLNAIYQQNLQSYFCGRVIA
jgi:hypothetical protein